MDSPDQLKPKHAGAAFIAAVCELKDKLLPIRQTSARATRYLGVLLETPEASPRRAPEALAGTLYLVYFDFHRTLVL